MALNLSNLKAVDAGLAELYSQAKQYAKSDPNVCLIKLRTYGERAADLLAKRSGLSEVANEPQFDLLSRLQQKGALPKRVGDHFHVLRMTGNAATHDGAGDEESAEQGMKAAAALGEWLCDNLRTVEMVGSQTSNAIVNGIANLGLVAFPAATALYLAPKFNEAGGTWVVVVAIWVVALFPVWLLGAWRLFTHKGVVRRRLHAVLALIVPTMGAWCVEYLQEGENLMRMGILLLPTLLFFGIELLIFKRRRASKKK